MGGVSVRAIVAADPSPRAAPPARPAGPVRGVRLGHAGPTVGEIGLGAFALSGAYGPADEGEAIATIGRALDLGPSLIDTADEYGGGHNELLVGRAVRGRRDEVVLATKVGIVLAPPGPPSVCGRPAYLREALEASLRRLGVDAVDLVYLHPVDPSVPVEESVGALAEAVARGEARHLGLCEVGAADLRRAAAVHAVTALQSEYSLWARNPEGEVLPAAAELGVGFVAFSPLGRGFLAGAIASRRRLAEGDFRLGLPRFEEANLRANLALVERLSALAAAAGATPAQLALAWLRRRGVVPIPGTRRRVHLESNLAAAELSVGDEVFARLEEAFPPGCAAGARYPAASPYAP